jgi:magnesium chelatase subunit H
VQVQQQFPALCLQVFSDRDIDTRRSDIEAALATADVFFGSLLFDYDQVEWLRQRVAGVPVRFVFESALELMSCTQVGSFQMAAPNAGDSKAGPPPAVKKMLSLFGSGKEEDRLSGYLSFLKVGPKILRFFPMQKAQDLRAWCAVLEHPMRLVRGG